MAMMVIASVLVWPTPQTHAAQDAGSSNTWNMTYHAGAAPIRAETKISVTMDGGKILFRAKKGPEFAIPLDQITPVSYNVRGRYGAASRAEAKFADSLSTPACIGDYNPCVFAVVAATLLIIPSYPIKTTERLVQIVWRDRNVDEEIVLKLHKNDFDAFLGPLEKATAKPWKNLDAEWVKIQQELKNAESSKIPIQLERKVRIAKSDLEPGTYQIVLLEGENNRGELYFFPGNDVNVERLAAVVAVDIAPAEGNDKLQLNYKLDASGKTTISSLHTSSKVLQFL